MSAKHTPGPWVYALDDGPIGEPMARPSVTTVARCCDYVIGLPSSIPGGNYRDGDPSGDPEADARLIAAAPDLLDALQRIADETAATWVCDIARAAIAKATGEPA